MKEINKSENNSEELEIGFETDENNRISRKKHLDVKL